MFCYKIKIIVYWRIMMNFDRPTCSNMSNLRIALIKTLNDVNT